MSGPTPMALGAFAFEALGFGYEAVTQRINTAWAEIPVAQGLDQMQWTGPKSIEITIRGVLFPTEFGGQSSLEGIKAAALTGVPLMLVSGGMAQGLIYGMYAVQSVDEDRSYHTAAGVPRRNAYSINLRRYGQSLTGGALGAVLSLFG